MSSKLSKKISLADLILAILILGAVAVSGYLIYRIVSVKEDVMINQVTEGSEETPRVDYDTPEPTGDDISKWVVPAEKPRYISSPSIGMGKVRVETVGRNAKNAVDVPVNVWNSAWFNESALPGVDGAGLYNCHTFFGYGYGTCNSLKNLKNSDEVVVERGDGVTYTYSVIEVRDLSVEDANSYMKTLLKVPEGYGATQSISLITCSGNYDTATQTSDRRLTIRAVLVR